MKLAEAFVEFNADLTKLKTGFSEAENITEKSLKRIGDKMQAVGKKMAIIGAAATAAFGVAVKQSADFEAMLKRVELQSGATANEMESIKAEALSSDFVKLGKSGTDVANMYNRLASEGYEVIEMKKMLKPITETSIALGTEEGETTKLMLNLMEQYNLEATDMGHISDVLAGALANTSFQGNELVEVMKYAGVAASELGWSLEGTIPIVDSVIKVTGEASMAGTQFRMMVNMLLDPTAKMEEEFKKVGISLNEVSEAIKSPIDLIALLNKAHENGANFAAMFGARAGSAAAVISRQEIPAIQKLTEEVNKTGFAHEAAGDMMDTTAGKIAAFKASLENLRDTIGDTLLPVLSELTDQLTGYVTEAKKWIDANEEMATSITKWGAGIGASMAVLGPFMIMLPGLVIAFKGISTAIFNLGTKLGSFAAALGLTAGQFAALATEIVWITKITWDWIQAIKEGARISVELEMAEARLETAQKKVADALNITVDTYKRWLKEGYGVEEMLFRAGVSADEFTAKLKGMNEEISKTTEPDTRTFEDFLAEVNEMAAISDILRPAREAIEELSEGMNEIEKVTQAIHEDYAQRAEELKKYIEDEKELAAAMKELQEGEQAAIELATEKIEKERELQEKRKSATETYMDSLQEIEDRIDKLTLTDDEYTLKSLNNIDELTEKRREYIEEIKEAAMTGAISPEEEKEALDKVDAWWEKAIENLKTLLEGKKIAIVDAQEQVEQSAHAELEAIKSINTLYREQIELINQATKAAAEQASVAQATETASNQSSQNTIPQYNIYDENGKPIGTTDKPDAYQQAYPGHTLEPIDTYQHGTPYVPQTGLYQLHQGEAVIPANQNTYNQQRTYSPNVIVNVAGDGDPNAIERAVENALNNSAREFRRTGYELIPGMS